MIGLGHGLRLKKTNQPLYVVATVFRLEKNYRILLVLERE